MAIELAAPPKQVVCSDLYTAMMLDKCRGVL